MEGYIAEIRLFAGNFPPRGWAFCQGQILSIAQNTALFALIGTTYGGNGQTTFALPDLRGRVAVGPGQAPGLPSINLGAMSGQAAHTLINTEMPAHNHAMQVTVNAYDEGFGGGGDGSVPTNRVWSSVASGAPYNSTSNTAMSPNAVQVVAGVAGGSQPHNNMQPYLGLNYIICMEGIFPSRN